MITVAMSIIISQPFNLFPAKSSLRNFFKPKARASRDKSRESTFERFAYSISKRITLN